MKPLDPPPPPTVGAPGSPVGDGDLHAWVDRQLGVERRAEVERHLAEQPEDRERVQAWEQQRAQLHALLDPVLAEPLPARFTSGAEAGPRRRWSLAAAAVLIAVASAGLAWVGRGWVDAQGDALALRGGSPATGRASAADTLPGFAHRAAIAHAVYSPEVRRPVEVGSDQEQQLVAWLSKRLGTPIRAPGLRAVGYELVGGRLLPGESGPVAQFMYQDGTGQRLTLYVTHEPPKVEGRTRTAFRFGREGSVNVFYWVDREFGYALSGAADKDALLKVGQEVFRQLAPGG